jgi:hypothetical protein
VGLDKSALIAIAIVLKQDIETAVETGNRDHAGWAYVNSRALSLVVDELDHSGLNPFNDDDWAVITGEE